MHTKFRLSKCNFLTLGGLHEICVVSRKLIPQEFVYACNVFEGPLSIRHPWPFSSRFLWRGSSWNCPSLRSVLCRLLYGTEHFSGAEKFRENGRKRGGQQRGQKRKNGHMKTGQHHTLSPSVFPAVCSVGVFFPSTFSLFIVFDSDIPHLLYFSPAQGLARLRQAKWCDSEQTCIWALCLMKTGQTPKSNSASKWEGRERRFLRNSIQELQNGGLPIPFWGCRFPFSVTFLAGHGEICPPHVWTVFWIFQVLFRPSGKGRKKGRFQPISWNGGQTPLKPPFVTPSFAATQISRCLTPHWVGHFKAWKCQGAEGEKKN